MAESHYHVTASRDRRDGTTDRHRYAVASEFIESDAAIAKEMGYTVKRELCYDGCLDPTVKS